MKIAGYFFSTLTGKMGEWTQRLRFTDYSANSTNKEEFKILGAD
jgi:hypothetical protein